MKRTLQNKEPQTQTQLYLERPMDDDAFSKWRSCSETVLDNDCSSEEILNFKWFSINFDLLYFSSIEN